MARIPQYISGVTGGTEHLTPAVPTQTSAFDADQKIFDGLANEFTKLADDSYKTEATEQAVTDQTASPNKYVGTESGLLGSFSDRQKAYNKVAKLVYANEIQISAEQKKNDLFAKYYHDPDAIDKVKSEMEAYKEQVLPTVPVDLQPHISSIIDQHATTLDGEFQKLKLDRDSAAVASKSKVQLDQFMQDTWTKAEAGDFTGAAQSFQSAQATQQGLIQHGYRTAAEAAKYSETFLDGLDEAKARKAFKDAPTLADKEKYIQSIENGDATFWDDRQLPSDRRHTIATKLTAELKHQETLVRAGLTTSKTFLEQQITALNQGFGETDPVHNNAIAATLGPELQIKLNNARRQHDQMLAFKRSTPQEQSNTLNVAGARALNTGATKEMIDFYKAAKTYHDGYMAAKQSGTLPEYLQNQSVLKFSPLTIQEDTNGNLMIGTAQEQQTRRQELSLVDAQSGEHNPIYTKDELRRITDAYDNGNETQKESIEAQLYSQVQGDPLKTRMLVDNLHQQNAGLGDAMALLSIGEQQMARAVSSGGAIYNAAKKSKATLFAAGTEKQATNYFVSKLQSIYRDPNTPSIAPMTDKNLYNSAQSALYAYIYAQQRAGKLGETATFDSATADAVLAEILGSKDGKLPVINGKPLPPFYRGGTSTDNVNAFNGLTRDMYEKAFNMTPGGWPRVAEGGGSREVSVDEIKRFGQFVPYGEPGKYLITIPGHVGRHVLTDPYTGRPEVFDAGRIQDEMKNVAEVARKAAQGVAYVNDMTDQFNTKLSDSDEQKFEQWVQANGKQDDLKSYDLRGAWKAIQEGKIKPDERGHLPDTWKKPNHPTFSNESIYSGKSGYTGGQWIDSGDHIHWTFNASPDNLKFHNEDYLNKYFSNVEPDSKIVFPKKIPPTNRLKRTIRNAEIK